MSCKSDLFILVTDRARPDFEWLTYRKPKVIVMLYTYCGRQFSDDHLFWFAHCCIMKSIKILDMHDSENCLSHDLIVSCWEMCWPQFYLAEKPMAEEDGFVVRLRGLPWAVTDEDILKFFGTFLILLFIYKLT